MISLAVLLQATDHASKLNIQNVASQHLSFFELLIKGGVILIPLGILSLISVYIMAEKYFYIHKNTKVDAKLKADFLAALKKGENDKALAVLQTSKTAYSTIFTHAVKDFSLPANEIENEIESVSNIEVAKMAKNMNYLGWIAGIAPMLGFIGTISGIIKIFYNISITDNISIGVISGGLYEKMISSGSGLIVGVIAYSGFHLLNMIIDKFISNVEADAFDVLNIRKSTR